MLGISTFYSRIAFLGGSLVAATILTVPAEVGATTGSLLVPVDLSPGYYWATPLGSFGGYVEACADYDCDIGGGLIKNWVVDGETLVAIPAEAVMVNVQYVNLTPAQIQESGQSQYSPSGSEVGGACLLCGQIGPRAIIGN